MGRGIKEEIRQNRCIKFMCCIGLLFFVLCFFPVVTESTIDSPNTAKLIPHTITRAVAVAVAFPLLLDYVYDFSLPQRLTFPRTILLLSLLVPNTTVLLMSISPMHSGTEKVSVCFRFATSQLFMCGLTAYVAGEVVSVQLLLLLAFVTTWTASWNLYFISKVFVLDTIPTPVLALIMISTSILLMALIVLFARDTKTLDKRRKMFAIIYITTIGVYAFVMYVSYFVLGWLRYSEYTEDSSVLLQAVTAAAVISITSRMAQHDATIAMNMLQSKKNFVRYISHEIRTPLNTVFMGIQLARTQLAEDNTVDAGNILHDVEESCVEAVAILNDILLYDKIEDGRMELEKNTIALKMLVKNVVDLFIVQARRSNIDFQIFYPALLDCAYCYVDVNKCSQVVRNIVSNALKFTPAGGAVKLFCKLETECGEALTELIDPSEEKVIFRCEVHDTGPGISLENQSKLFGSIVQFHAAELQGGGGSGLGLWISKAIMNAHGGDLWVRSSGVAGEGCVFGMELQVTHMQMLDDAITLSHSVGSSGHLTPPSVIKENDTKSLVPMDPELEESHYNHLHVLVVDDSIMNRKMLILQLKALGIVHITQSCNGLEAVEAVAERMADCGPMKIFDIIFMDCIMPVMGGNAATKKIRELGFIGAIISVTGNGLPEDVNDILSCGSNKVLVKPVKAIAVQDVIREYSDMAPLRKPFATDILAGKYTTIFCEADTISMI